MSKINLGSISLHKESDSVNDFIILSDVVDTSMSYCIPKLIRSVEDLNLYFGTSFKSRNYYIELLKQGITLYLYRPTLTERTPLITSLYGDSLEDYEGYIDYINYKKVYKGYNKFQVESIGTTGNLYYGPLPGYWIYKDSEFVELQKDDLENYSDYIKFYIDDNVTTFPEPEEAEVFGEKYLYIREIQSFWTIDEDGNLIYSNSSDGTWENKYYNGFFEDELPEKGKQGYLYLKNIDSSNGPWIWKQEDDDIDNEYGEFVEIGILDQYLSKEKYLESYYNRDSIRLFDQYDKDYVEDRISLLNSELEEFENLDNLSEKEIYTKNSINSEIKDLYKKYTIKNGNSFIENNPKYLEYTRPRYDNQYFNYIDEDNKLYNELNVENSKLEDIENDYSYSAFSITIPNGDLISREKNYYTESEENDLNEYPYILITERDNNLENDYLFWFYPGVDEDEKKFTNPLGSDYLNIGNHFAISLLKKDKDENGKEIEIHKTNKEIFNDLCNKIVEKDNNETKDEDSESNSLHIGYRFIRNGEYIDNDTSEDVEGCYLEIYTNSICFIRYFSTIKESIISPNYQRTFDTISIVSDEHKRIDFFSRTIGQSPDLDGNISIKIEKLNSDKKDGWYSIEISRYNYSEYFEGSIFPLDEYQNRSYYRLDNIINDRSKLVECKLHLYRSNGTLYKPGDHDSLLTEGTWELKRAYKESYNTVDFWNSLNILYKSNVNEDFLLVPDIKLYIGNYIPTDDTVGYYKEYEKFKSYASNKNCQVLIENKISNYNRVELNTYKSNKELNKLFDDTFPENLIISVPSEDDSSITYYQIDTSDRCFKEISFEDKEDYWKIKTDNTEFNYTDDLDNLLVYFYDSIYINNYYRPGYYVFIKGIITGDFLEKISDSSLLYYPPLNETYLLNYSDNSFRKKLESRKSNYLVSNNIYYYYDKLLNGDSYSTTITTRFLISRVSREFERKKFEIIGKNSKVSSTEGALKIIKNIQESFSYLVKYIYLDKLLLVDNYVIITISMIISEFIDKNIKINITLKY